MSFLEWISYLFQYTKKVAICVKCWEIDSRALGWEFQLGKFNKGYGDYGMGQRRLKIEENLGKCTEQVFQLEASLYVMPAQTGSVDLDTL